MSKADYDPFELALARTPAEINARLELDDVLELEPRMSRTDAEKFLKAHDATIAAAMLTAGLEMMGRLLESKGN